MCMKFISRLFHKPLRRSALEEFGDSLTTRAIATALRTSESRDDRIAWGVATTVLVTARNFAVGLQKQVSEMPVPSRRDYRLPYDDIMIEAAAFCHYVLSRDYPPSDDFDDGGTDADDGSPDDPEDVNGSDSCAKALFFSQGLLLKFLPTGYPEGFLERRWLFYVGKVLPRDDRTMAEFFCSIVLTIIEEKAPHTSGIKGLGPGMQVTLAAGTYVPMFYQTHIAALREMTGNLFRNADALLRELSHVSGREDR